jgi:DNA-binding MarR family transcriptional regulator
LQDRISFLVHRINAHLMRDTNPKLKIWGLDLTESRLMVALLENGPMAAGDIVRIMALPQSTISHQVKRLEKLGYITRTIGEKDSRMVIATLTERGREVAIDANAHSRDVTDRLLEAIGPDEVERVRSAMKRVDEAFSPIR